jgi:hypothetical protein
MESVLTEEEAEVLAWRFEQLVAHGYEPGDAAVMAEDTSIDLELARRLTVLGCPIALATQILV